MGKKVALISGKLGLRGKIGVVMATGEGGAVALHTLVHTHVDIPF